VETGPPIELKSVLLPFPAPNSLRLLHASKFLGIKTAPMSRESLLEEGYTMREDGALEETGYNNQLTIRWRERTLPSGETAAESNARFVLHVGTAEWWLHRSIAFGGRGAMCP